MRPEDIMNLHKPSKEEGRGVHGFYKVGAHSYHYYLDSSVLSKIAVTDDPLSAGFEPIRMGLEEAEELQAWEEEDLARLGINHFLHGLDESKLKNLPISEMAAICMEAASLEMNATLEGIGKNEEV